VGIALETRAHASVLGAPEDRREIEDRDAARRPERELPAPHPSPHHLEQDHEPRAVALHVGG
jgi:hypothetical protein